MLHKRSIVNIITAVSYQAVNTLLGLILPYLFITEFGSETNGLLSSVTQLFVYVNLLEGGVGGATIQALYKPISRKDETNICEIMAATSRYYLKTGFWYGVLVIILAVVYPFVISTQVPIKTVCAVIMLQGASGVWSYLVQGKYSLLLRADGRMYIINIFNLFASILKNVGKIWAIACGYSIVVVQIVHFLITVLQSLMVVIYIKKRYKWLTLKVSPDFDAISQRNAVLVQQIAWIVFNHTDIIILTIVNKNLVLVSIYALYTLVFDAIQNVVETACKSIQFRLGEYSQKNLQSFADYCLQYRKKYMLLIFSLLATTYLLLKPFMQLYVGEVSDGNYLMQYLPELFLVCKLLYLMRDLNLQIINVVGHFKEAQKIAVAEMALNMAISLCLAPVYHIYGVLSGTLVALLFSCIAYTWYTNRVVLQKKEKNIYLHMWTNGITMIFICWFGKQIMPEIGSFFGWIVTAVPLTIVIFSIFSLIYICGVKWGKV